LTRALAESVFAELVGLPQGVNQHSLLGAVVRILSITLKLNVVLGLFNLIPFPPLDGAAVLEGAAPKLGGSLYTKLREVPAFEILGLLASWRLFPYVAGPALSLVVQLLYA
jgi:Zn-dependent protease